MCRLIILTFAVTACSASPTQAPPDAGDGGGQLAGGGTIVGEGGVQLTATTGAIADPVVVQIAAVAAPAAPLPAETTPLGAFYTLASNRELRVPAGSALVLGLPVPAGADGAHLVAMALVSTAELVSSSGAVHDVWLPLAGRFDASRKLFFTTLQALSVAGHTFTLAARPDVASGSVAVARLRDRSATDITMLGHDFNVGCLGYTEHQCPGSSQVEMALELASARTAMLDRGFPEPRLALDVAEVDTTHVVARGYNVWLAAEGSEFCYVEGDDVGGVYHPDFAQLFVCLPAGATSLGAYDQVADHEYFHALQFAYGNVLANWAAGTIEQFLIEGSAAVAGGSTHAISPRRDLDFAMHVLDVEMRSTADEHEYEAQDLWVYLGRRAGLGIEYLIPMLDAGATIDAINQHLPGGDLHRRYFDYVANNVFEGPETYDGLLVADCTIQSGMFKDNVGSWIQPAPVPEGDLPPLTARAIFLQWVDPQPGTLVQNISGDSNIHYTVYKQNDCGPVPEGPRRVDPAMAGAFFYIVLANTGFTSSAHYKLQLR
jgi:hypothetical protein